MTGDLIGHAVGGAIGIGVGYLLFIRWRWDDRLIEWMAHRRRGT